MPKRPSATTQVRRSVPSESPDPSGPPDALQVAIVGAGMAGVACARTLAQAGMRVTLIERGTEVGGRMASRQSEFGVFDPGAQYFTVRDERFALALETARDVVRPWAVSTVRVLDELGHVLASAPPPREPHFVAKPSMNALVSHWSQPLLHSERFGGLAAQAHLATRVTRIERDALHPSKWQLKLERNDGSQQVLGGYDRVVLAVPGAVAHDLLLASGLAPALRQALTQVHVAPCWTLMVAFPNAMQPGLSHLGPQWNAARSTHHRISWLAREGSKPGRDPIERWTIQADPEWSAKHLGDDPERVKGKLLRGFAEITGIRATPAHAVVQCWPHAQTRTPLGRSHLFDPELGLGLCGDWCLGHRVEDAFISGLELALALAR
ncbi:MAG: FAD-dependent oxidoreductase [Burkholderiaceae bacterium]